MSAFHQEPFRLPTALGVGEVKTYQVALPKKTHYRPATCEEVDCQPYRYGFATTVDESTELGQRQAHYIRKVAGRKYTETRGEALTMFDFEAGQPCFSTAEHVVPLDRPGLFIVRDGDWRGNPSGRTRTHAYASDWVEDFQDHQQQIADRVERG